MRVRRSNEIQINVQWFEHVFTRGYQTDLEVTQGPELGARILSVELDWGNRTVNLLYDRDVDEPVMTTRTPGHTSQMGGEVS